MAIIHKPVDDSQIMYLTNLKKKPKKENKLNKLAMDLSLALHMEGIFFTKIIIG
jgi:hypothetical protein